MREKKHPSRSVRDANLTTTNFANSLPFRFSVSLQNKAAEDHLARTDL